MSKPRFSVLIAAYNAEKFLARTLDSVFAQTYREFELIVVDDGSSDGTAALVETYRQRDPAVAVTAIRQPRKGLGGARNSGMRAARHPLVAFLDHDDIWYEDKLARMADVLSARDDLDIVSHDELLVERVGDSVVRQVRLRYEIPEASKYEGLLLRGRTLSGSATVVRKSRLFEVGLFVEGEDWHGVEDYDMWLKLARADCRMHFVPEVLGEYVRHSGNLSRDVRFNERLVRVLDDHFAAWPKPSLYYRYLMRKRRAEAFRAAGKSLMEMAEFGQARTYLRKSLGTDPLSWKAMALWCLLHVRQTGATIERGA